MLSEKTTRIGFSPSSYRKAQLIKGSIGIKGKKKKVVTYTTLHLVEPLETPTSS